MAIEVNNPPPRFLPASIPSLPLVRWFTWKRRIGKERCYFEANKEKRHEPMGIIHVGMQILHDEGRNCYEDDGPANAGKFAEVRCFTVFVFYSHTARNASSI